MSISRIFASRVIAVCPQFPEMTSSGLRGVQTVLTIVICFLFLATAQPVWAQEEPPAAQSPESPTAESSESDELATDSETPEAAPETPAQNDPPSANPTSGVTSEADAAPAKPPLERFIYIPYDKLNDVINRVKSKVVISYEEYLDLVKRAGEAVDPVEPASQAVISKAEYTAVVAGDVVEITARLECEALQRNWAELPVQFGQAAVGGMDSDGPMKVLLRGVGDGKYVLMFESAGKSVVTLKLMTPIKRSPAGPSVQMQVPPVGITTFSLEVPKPNFDITISPRNLPLKLPEPPPENVTRKAVSLGATETIAATWVPQTTDRPEMDLLTTVTNDLQVSVRDGLIHTDATLSYRILRGELSTVRIAAPLNHRILDVTSSARIQGWTTEKQEAAQTVTIELLSAVKDAVKIELHTEQTLTEDTLRLGGMPANGPTYGIHALDVTREQGTLTVTHGEELTLVVEQQAGLVRVESEKPQANQLSFRYFSPEFQFAVNAEPVQPILDVTHEAYVIVRQQRIETDSRLQYTVRRTGLFQLELELPAGLNLLGVDCAQMAEFQHTKPTGKLTIVMKERVLGQIAVRIRGSIPLSADEQTVALDNLPLVKPLNIRQEMGQVGLFTIAAIEIAAADDQVVSAQSIPVNQIGAKFPDATLRAAWKFQTRPVVIPIRTIRRPTRMTAQTATKVNVEPAGIQVETIVNFQIQYAGVDEFRIAVPASVSDRVQITVVDNSDTPILQKTPETAAKDDEDPAEEDAPEDSEEVAEADDAVDTDAEITDAEMVVWKIQTQRPVTGRQRFKLSYDIPLAALSDTGETSDSSDPAEQTSAAQSLQQSVLLINPLGLNTETADNAAKPELSRSSGELAVDVDPALSTQLQIEGVGVEPIDVRELKLLPQAGQQAYRFAVQSADEPIELTLSISRFEVESVVSTVVSRMLSEFAIGVSEDIAVRTRLKLKTSQRQRLVLQLPADVQVMQVMVNQEIRQLQKGDQSSAEGMTNYLLNVSRPGDSDQEFMITLQYLQSVPPLKQLAPRGSLSLTIPTFLSAANVPAVVQQSRVVVWLPDDYVPVTVTEPFQRVNQNRQISLSTGVLPEYNLSKRINDWLGDSSSTGLDFPTAGQAYLYESIGLTNQLELTYWNRSLVLTIFTLALIVIAFILMKTSWENRVFVAISVTVMLAVILQYEPHLVMQGVYSARFGLLGLAAIWLVHAMFGFWQLLTSSMASTSPAQAAQASGNTIPGDESGSNIHDGPDDGPPV